MKNRVPVELRKSSNSPPLTLDALIERLLKIKQKIGGEAVVSILMEPEVGGDVVQLEDPLSDVASSEGSVHLLGQSFD